jgi:hypothetical protein
MTDSGERLEQLERRVAQLETLVRQLAARVVTPAQAAVAQRPLSDRPVTRPSSSPVSLGPSVPAMPPPAKHAAVDWEQWVGRRGLLAVGVFALIATGGFLLKHAIEQGWISPELRVTGGVLLGAAIAAWGDTLIARRRLRLYGAALVGGGAGLAYLAVWAAAAPYGLVERRLGILLLLGITVGLAARAVRHRIPELLAWALAGAYGAPFFVRSPDTAVTTLLGYLTLIAVGSGAIALRLSWRLPFALAVAGFFLLPLMVPLPGLAIPLFAVYTAAGGVAVLLVTERRAWPESRLGAVVAAWSVLATLVSLTPMADDRWLTLACALGLAVAAWRFHVTHDPFAADVAVPDPAEVVVFAASPLLAVALAAVAPPAALREAAGAVPAVLALLYFAGGWPRRSTALVVMGFLLAALAVVAQWNYAPVAVGWAALGAAAVAADRWNDQPAGRPVALALVPLALSHLFLIALADPGLERSPAAAFRDGWSLAWYAVTALATLAAAWWRPRPTDGPRTAQGRIALWALAGAAVWLGGSVELRWAFADRLAGDLAISAFWLLYAGALVAAGFRLGRQPLRVAGLFLASLGAAKIVFYDLSQLEALYRVGSFFALALIALAVAYAYNRRKLAS